MMLIVVDAFLEKMKRTSRYFDVKFDIEEMPTIDAVTVVRCKDCIRRYDTDECQMCYLQTARNAARILYCPVITAAIAARDGFGGIVMGNELQQIIGAVTPGTEVLLYMRAEAQKEPELQIVVRRGKRRIAKSWDLMTLRICDAPPASSAKLLADAARDMDAALRELEKVG